MGRWVGAVAGRWVGVGVGGWIEVAVGGCVGEVSLSPVEFSSVQFVSFMHNTSVPQLLLVDMRRTMPLSRSGKLLMLASVIVIIIIITLLLLSPSPSSLSLSSFIFISSISISISVSVISPCVTQGLAWVLR